MPPVLGMIERGVEAVGKNPGVNHLTPSARRPGAMAAGARWPSGWRMRRALALRRPSRPSRICAIVALALCAPLPGERSAAEPLEPRWIGPCAIERGLVEDISKCSVGRLFKRSRASDPSRAGWLTSEPNAWIQLLWRARCATPWSHRASASKREPTEAVGYATGLDAQAYARGRRPLAAESRWRFAPPHATHDSRARL